MINNKNFKFFVDFDGTISQKDVGDLLVSTFGEKEAIKGIITKWINKEISSSDSWIQMINVMSDYNQSKIDSIIESIEIDEHFKNFVALCEKNNFGLMVLSDGWDYYIERIFQNNGLNIPFYSNKVKFVNDKVTIEFPHQDEECQHCGNCKRNHVLLNSADDESEYSFYIGDGNSDVCPILFCDYIFAKGSLLKYCELNRISYYPFTDFSTVINITENLFNKKRLKKRYQSQLNRKRLYQLG